MRLLTLMLTLFAGSCLTAQSVLYVPANYPTIQSAIVAASSGDAIIVSNGTYTESIDYLGKAIAIYAAVADQAIIQGVVGVAGDVTAVTFASGETASSILSGFRISNIGGPTICSSALGILIDGAGPTIENCTIEMFCNDPMGTGGAQGIRAENGADLLLDYCRVRNCNATGIGTSSDAIRVSNGTASIRDCDINNNNGFGIILNDVSDGSVLRTRVQGNYGEVGGGISVRGGTVGSSPVVIDRCTITDNLNWNLFVRGDLFSSIPAEVRVENTLIARAAGGFGPGRGVTLQDAIVTLLNCSVVDNNQNTGGGPVAGIVDDGNTVLTVERCIVWGNIPAMAGANAGISMSAGSTISVNHSDVQDASAATLSGWGTGNINTDPFFVAAASSDYRLLETSPCIESGSPFVPALGAQDLSLRNRRLLFTVDIGAYEWEAPIGPISLGLTRAAGSGDLVISNQLGNTYGNYITLLSFESLNATAAGQGPWYGMWLDVADVLTQVNSGAAPFIGVLDIAGSSTFQVPVSVPAGTTLWGVTQDFGTSISRSAVASITF